HFVRPAEFRIAASTLEAVVRLAYGLQSLPRQLRQRRAIEQHASAGVRSATNSPAKLVKLGEAHAFGVLYDHQRRIGYVHADLDNGRGDEKLDLPRLEREHRLI